MNDIIAEIRARHEAAQARGGDSYNEQYSDWYTTSAHADRAALLARVEELEREKDLPLIRRATDTLAEYIMQARADAEAKAEIAHEAVQMNQRTGGV